MKLGSRNLHKHMDTIDCMSIPPQMFKYVSLIYCKNIKLIAL